MIPYFDREKLFYWLLGMSAAAVALPSNNYGAISMVFLFTYWLIYKPLMPRIHFLLQEKWAFIVLSIPFLIQVFGLVYTNEPYKGILAAQLSLPFIVYALLMFSALYDKELSRFVLKWFFMGTLIASMMGLTKAIYYKLNNLGDYFFYSRFSELLGKHTTSFSLFIVLSMLFLMHEAIKGRRKWRVVVPILLFFILMLYFISTRISIIGLGTGMAVLLLMNVKRKRKWLALSVPILVLGLFAMPNFQKRFEPSGTEIGQISDVEFRKYHWKSVIETIQSRPLLLGTGSGSDRAFLFEKYKYYRLTSAYELNYNAHNQFLEYLLDFGLLGLFSILTLLSYLYRRMIKDKNGLGLSMLSVFTIYFITESLFSTQAGVVTFALIMSVLLAYNPEKA